MSQPAFALSPSEPLNPEVRVERSGVPMALPTTMRAVVQSNYGAPTEVLSVAEVPVPSVGAGEVLVRVEASSVNTPDWLFTSGTPWILRLMAGVRRPKAPVRGTDLAGVVVAVGPGADLAVGDRVFGSNYDEGLRRWGTFAEYAVVPAGQLAPIPDGVSFEEAAAVVMSGLTAYKALVEVAKVREGVRVLINGASGGIGVLATQMAVKRGAVVTGVCSGRNVELVRGLGAADVIDYTKEDFTQSGREWDVVLDNVLNHAPGQVARVVADGGIYIPNSVGQGSSALRGLPRMLSAWVLGKLGRLGVRAVTISYERERMEELAGELSSGLEVPIERVYALEEVGEAVGHMMSLRARGKLVVGVGT